VRDPAGDLIVASPDVTPFVRPHAFDVSEVAVREHDAALDDVLRGAAAAMRTRDESPVITADVRAMYRRFGVDPTKTRPSSEALLRRVRRGDPLPRVNNLVDVINWCSFESQLPFGLYDRGHITGQVVLRLGRPGESYSGIRKDDVHIEGRLALADEAGPFGNPTSDSARTMITPETRRALVVIFAPTQIPPEYVQRTADTTRERISQFCR
jgi:DNA/RNA-binding domain of Phe-tRNA-synthetase-like protein